MISAVVAFLGPWAAKAAASRLWRYRWWILGGVGTVAMVAYIGFLKWQVDHYRKSADEWAEIAETAEQVNAENLKAFHELEAEKKRVERLLNQRIARKSKEADRLGDLVQHILSQEKSNACAASPAIRALLDGLRAGSTQP